jgi:hypothetical protein
MVLRRFNTYMAEISTNQSKKQHKMKKYLIMFGVALVTPGGFLILGIYGIKKFLDKRKQDVQTKRS